MRAPLPRVILTIALASVIGFVGCGGGSSSAGFPSGPLPAGLPDAESINAALLRDLSKKAGCELKTNKDEGAVHASNPDKYKYKFKANPPTSGTHHPEPAEDGAYPPSKPAKTETTIHALEHGRIIFQWKQGAITDQQLGSLKALFDDEPYKLLLNKNTTNMPYKIAATAWNRSLGCNTVTPDTYRALRAFHSVWVDRGPERVD